jgi:hypothetical protein
MQIIDDRLERGKQSWKRTVTVQWSGYKLRAVIDRDSYDFQSRIFVEVWAPEELQWNRIQTLSGSDHGDLPSYVTKDEDAINYATEELIEELLAYAQLILA